jgi:hypothetical protein
MCFIEESFGIKARLLCVDGINVQIGYKITVRNFVTSPAADTQGKAAVKDIIQ